MLRLKLNIYLLLTFSFTKTQIFKEKKIVLKSGKKQPIRQVRFKNRTSPTERAIDNISQTGKVFHKKRSPRRRSRELFPAL